MARNTNQPKPTDRRGVLPPRPDLKTRIPVSVKTGMVRTPKGDDIPHHTPLAVLYDRWTHTDTIPVIEIHWLDAISTGDDWITEHDLDTRPAPSIAIGYLTSETEHTLTVTALINEEHYANGITIPKGCIIHTRTLTP